MLVGFLGLRFWGQRFQGSDFRVRSGPGNIERIKEFCSVGNLAFQGCGRFWPGTRVGGSLCLGSIECRS